MRKLIEKKLRVADLFCGGGGISEGLKQAGLSIVFGLDNSKAAVDTFAHNHPGAEAVKGAIEDLDIQDLPEFDVLVGGPPCVEFSASKQGRGNILAGLKLVQAFLCVVHIRKPKYWIMENVPKIVLHLPERIPLKWIGIDEPGELYIPVRAHFNTAEYGVPQMRERFLMGNFPIPSPTHCDPNSDVLLGKGKKRTPWVCLRDVLKSLPSPLKSMPKRKIKDLNYDLELPVDLLSDHFHEVELSKDEARRIRKVKEEHPFMGRMPFPDAVNRPARTVVATQLGRETLVIGERINGVEKYRRATVRECAVMQGYPISYQIFGSGLSARYRVVGNGVPPMLTYHIGRGIQRDAGLRVPRKPKILRVPKVLSPAIFHQAKRKSANHKIGRRFSELVPGKEVRGCRVELTNQTLARTSAQLYSKSDLHIVDWACRLTVGEGKAKMRQRFFSLQESLVLLEPLFLLERETELLIKMVEEITKRVVPDLCDASTLQASWAGKIENVQNPENIVDKVSIIINKYFPSERYKDKYISSNIVFDLLPSKGIRIRLAVAVLVTSYCCEVLNKGTAWVLANKDTRYVDPSWTKDSKFMVVDNVNVLDLLEEAINAQSWQGEDLFLATNC